MTRIDKNKNDGPEAGLYEHYKGRRYRVIAVVHHSETDQAMVLYQALYGARGLWVRPLALFNDPVTIDGESQPRFRRIGD